MHAIVVTAARKNYFILLSKLCTFRIKVSKKMIHFILKIEALSVHSELTAGGAAGVLQDDALAFNNVHRTLKIIYFY